MAVSRFSDERPREAEGRQKSLAVPFPFKPLPQVKYRIRLSGGRPFMSNARDGTATGCKDPGYSLSARGEVSC